MTRACSWLPPWRAQLESMQAGRITEEELRTAIHLEELQLQEEAEENSFWHDVAVSGYQVLVCARDT